MATKIITPECRISFPVLFVPKAPEPGKEPEFSASFLFALNTDLSDLEQALKEAAIEKYGERARDMFKAGQLKWPIKDQASKSHLAGYGEGSYFSARSKTRPGVVDDALAPIMDPTEVYAGMIVRASVNAFAYDHPVGGKGVSFGLQNVMIVKDDGVRYDGRGKPEQDFADFKKSGAGKPGGASKDSLWD